MNNLDQKNGHKLNLNDPANIHILKLWKNLNRGKCNSIIKLDLKRKRDSSNYRDIILAISKRKHWPFESTISSPNLFKFICQELDSCPEDYIEEISLISIKYISKYEPTLLEKFCLLTETEIPNGILNESKSKITGDLNSIKSITEELVQIFNKDDIKLLYLAFNTYQINNLENLAEVALNYIDNIQVKEKSPEEVHQEKDINNDKLAKISTEIKLLDNSIKDLKNIINDILANLDKNIIPSETSYVEFTQLRKKYDRILEQLYSYENIPIDKIPFKESHNYDISFIKSKLSELKSNKTQVRYDIENVFCTIVGLESEDSNLQSKLNVIKKDFLHTYYNKFQDNTGDNLTELLNENNSYKTLIDLIKNIDTENNELNEKLHSKIVKDFDPSIGFQVLSRKIKIKKIKKNELEDIAKSILNKLPDKTGDLKIVKEIAIGKSKNNKVKDDTKVNSTTPTSPPEHITSTKDKSKTEKVKVQEDKTTLKTIQVIKDSIELFGTEKDTYKKILHYLNNNMHSAAYFLNYQVNSKQYSNGMRLPNWLLESMAISNYVQEANGELSNRLKELYENYIHENLLYDNNPIWNDCINLLLFAATIIPALNSPITGASSILSDLKFNFKMETLNSLIRVIVEFSQLGFPLDKNYLKVFQSSYDIETQRNKLKIEVGDWLKRIKNKKLNYLSAKRVLRALTNKGGLVFNLVQPFIDNNLNTVRIRNLVAKCSDDFFEKEIIKTSRSVNPSRHKIDGLALNTILSALRTAENYAKQWLDLIEPKQSTNYDFISIKVKELKDIFNNLEKNLLSELKEFQQRDDLFANTSGHLALNSINALNKFFNPVEDQIVNEQSVTDYLEADIVILSSKLWYKILDKIYDDKQNKIIFEKFLDFLADKNVISNQFTKDLLEYDLDIDLYDIFKRNCDDGNHILTEKLISLINDKKENGKSQESLEEERSTSINKHQNQLMKNLNLTKNTIEIGLTEGLITENQRYEYLSTVNSVDLDSDFNFGYINYKLENIEKEINKFRETKKHKLSERLKTSLVKNFDQLKFQKLIDENKLATAQTYLESIERGEKTFKFPEDKSKLGDYLSSIKPLNKFLSNFDNKQVNFIEKIKKMNKNSNFAQIKLPPTKPQLYSLQDVLKSWFKIKFDKDVNDVYDLSVILKWLGFITNEENISNFSVDSQVPGNHKWFNFFTENVIQSPIPAFGTLANKKYKLLCVLTGESISRVIDIISHQRSDKALIVFNFWRIDEKGRRLLCKACYEDRISVLVIDDILMLYLAGVKESLRTNTLFELTLPFCFSLPYIIAAGNVPKEMFYGRKKELADILNPKGTCIIYGGRQLGKTAILRKISNEYHDPEKGLYIVFIDLKAKGYGITNQNPEYIWQLIGNELTKYGVMKNKQWKSFNQFEKELKDWLDKFQDSRILLLLDEADKFIEVDSKNNLITLSQLRGLMDDTNSRFKFILSGLHNVQRFTKISNSTISHLLTRGSYCIGPLIADGEQYEAVKLIINPFKVLGYEFENEEIIYKILNHTNYYPSLIQLFCDNLLKEMYDQINNKFDVNQNPPFLITNDNIDDVYSRKQKLRKDIIERFQWTLNLDLRYELIAYLVAHLNYEYQDLSREDLSREGLSITNIIEEAVKWKKGLFKSDNQYEDVRDILDEMIGLGILRRTKENKYSLKDSNIFRLLGNIDDIEMKLMSIDDNPPSIDLENESYRRSDLTKGYELSPFTARQESIIIKPENAVVLIGGLDALGIESSIHYLDLALNDLPITTNLDELQSYINTKKTFQQKLDEFFDSKNVNFSIFVISNEILWDESWIQYALFKIKNRKSKNYYKKVLFLADGSMIWSIYVHGKAAYDEFIKNGLKEIRLRKISDSMTYAWAHDHMIDIKEEILNSIGKWLGLYHKYLSKKEGNKIILVDPFTNSNNEILQKNLSELTKSFGLENKSIRELLVRMNAYDEPIGVEELYEWCENTIPLNVLQDIIDWCKYFSIVSNNEKNEFILDPIVGKVIGLINGR